MAAVVQPAAGTWADRAAGVLRVMGSRREAPAAVPLAASPFVPEEARRLAAARRLFETRRVRAFNLDGTLVHTLPDLAVALNQALREMGFQAVPQALVRASLHAGLEASVAAAVTYLRLPRAVQAPLLVRYRRRYQAGLVERSLPYDGVPELLSRLDARGERPAVCSNKPQRLAEELLETLGLRRHFAIVVGADTCDERKPHPAPLRRAVVRLGGRPAEALLVGDSAIDASCAEAVGVPHLWFGGGYGAPPAESPWRFDSHRALIEPTEERMNRDGSLRTASGLRC